MAAIMVFRRGAGIRCSFADSIYRSAKAANTLNIRLLRSPDFSS